MSDTVKSDTIEIPIKFIYVFKRETETKVDLSRDRLICNYKF